MTSFTEVMNDPEFQRRLLHADWAGEKKYYPVFSGHTKEDVKVAVFMHIVDKTLHILLPDGELWALAPDSTIVTSFDPDREIYHVKIISSVWVGVATGSRVDLLEEDMR